MCVARQIYCYTKQNIKYKNKEKSRNRKILWNYDHLSQIFLFLFRLFCVFSSKIGAKKMK